MTEPITTRFRKGQSGNPKGRPRKSAAPPSSFEIVRDRVLTVTLGGVQHQMPLEDALHERIYEQALAGKAMARRKLIRMIQDRDRARAERAPPPPPVAVRIEPTDPENTFEALQILGIAHPDPFWSQHGDQTGLLLEPWAVQLAINRRRRRQWSDQEISDVERLTDKSETLCWPNRSRS